jgi:hypothetical protein
MKKPLLSIIMLAALVFAIQAGTAQAHSHNAVKEQCLNDTLARSQPLPDHAIKTFAEKMLPAQYYWCGITPYYQSKKQAKVGYAGLGPDCATWMTIDCVDKISWPIILIMLSIFAAAILYGIGTELRIDQLKISTMIAVAISFTTSSLVLLLCMLVPILWAITITLAGLIVGFVILWLSNSKADKERGESIIIGSGGIWPIIVMTLVSGSWLAGAAMIAVGLTLYEISYVITRLAVSAKHKSKKR